MFDNGLGITLLPRGRWPGQYGDDRDGCRCLSRPSLAGVFGCKSGTEPGYNYLKAMKGANVIWDEKTLDEYLQGPGKFVRGTRMVYFVPNEKDRQDVIAYLKTLSK
jgi:cytochrome c2